MSLDEETLQNVARDGEMDYAKWPNLIEPLLQRLNQIVYSEFPSPRTFPSLSRQQPTPSSPTQPRSEPTTQQSSTTETPQPTTPVRPLPPVPLFPSSTTHITDSQSHSDSSQLDALPQPLLQLLTSIVSTLRSSFLSKPPHTIQRLSELILEPRKYYKTLPAWLRAVDRVVNVSSSADVFPLHEGPGLVNGVVNGGGGGILWRNDDTRPANGNSDLGSDESLGGALLTPIPWLRNRSGSAEPETGADGDTQLLSGDDDLGAAIIEASPVVDQQQDPLVPEREDGAVTQGELIRLEQEAGVVPVAGGVPPRGMEREGLDEGDEEDNVPHARGPDMVGAVDMGKVEGQEVEVSLSNSPPSKKTEMVHDAQDVLAGGKEEKVKEEKEGSDEGTEEFEMVSRGDEMEVDEVSGDLKKEEKDEDMVLVDADGKMDDEEKVGDEGETAGSDAVR